MATPEPTFERATRQRHTALLLVSTVDRRILPALRFVSRLPDTDVRAVHVALEPDVALRLARDWMDLGITWPPLHIEEPTADSLTLCVRRLVAQEASVRSHVTVLVPELDLNRWWQPLLHRGTGRAIAWELNDLPNVTTAVLPVRVELGADSATPARR